MRARLALFLVFAGEALALVVLARLRVPAPLDWTDPLGWLRRTDPETATLVVGRLLALVVAGWLLAASLLALAARAALATRRVPRRLRVVAGRAGRLAPGLVRHLVETAVAVGVVAATVTPATAAPAPRRVPPAAEARPLVAPLAPVRDGRATPIPTLPRLPLPDPDPSPAPAPAAWGHHRVVAGEHLWGIAEATVRARGRADDPAAVDRYWRALCEVNRDRIASGDVDTIRPGEELDLPPVA